MKITGNLEILTAEDARKYADVTEVGGWLDITAEAASLPKLAVEHAFYGWSLRRHINTGMWYAGCRGPWTTDEALAHWGERDDERARLFTAAIRKATK